MVSDGVKLKKVDDQIDVMDISELLAKKTADSPYKSEYRQQKKASQANN